MAKKRSFRGKPKSSKSAAGGSGNLMSQFQQMQEQMRDAQRNLENEYTTVTVGGGALTITISGHQRVKSIEIDPDVVDADDVDMLQDLLVAGINQAIEESQSMAAEKMEGITGNTGIGDMLGGLDI